MRAKKSEERRSSFCRKLSHDLNSRVALPSPAATSYLSVTAVDRRLSADLGQRAEDRFHRKIKDVAELEAHIYGFQHTELTQRTARA